VKNFVKKLKMSFRKKELLERAFTHPSWAHEHVGDRRQSYERLEFLGDAVYEMLLREYFYESLDHADEGMLSKLKNRYSSGAFMAEMARKYEIDHYLRLGRSEEADGRQKDSILANSFEALFGALYLDRGIKHCRRFFRSHVIPYIDLSIIPFDAKSRLNIRLSGERCEYKILMKHGEDHRPHFHVGLFVNGELVSSGEAGSKKKAELLAAEQYLDSLSKVT
jgi:ribonuclease-3